MSEEDKIEDFGGIDESPKRGKMGKVHHNTLSIFLYIKI
jgi:hypothetical protein